LIRRLLLLLALSPTAARAVPVDGGGRDVSVVLFSTREVRSLTINPIGTDTWTAPCANCVRTPLTGPLHVTSAELFAGGSLRITDDSTGDTRAATGLWHLRRVHRGGPVDVVLTLPSERYVQAVLNAESGAAEPSESLRALAIVVRTYALSGRHYSAAPGHLSADLCDSTQCQALRLGATSSSIDNAVQSTAGETLWFGARRAQSFFSQNCGGLTEDAGAVWPQLSGTPYLRSHPDPYCLRRDTAAWHGEISLAQLTSIARAENWRLPGEIASARVAQRSTSHRVLRIVFTGAEGTTGAVSADALRFGIGRALGWDRVRSDSYDLGIRNGNLVFDGRGHGHGVGLCQTGAAQMASEGKSARDILAFYFPGTTVRIAPDDTGWQDSRAGGIDVHSTRALSSLQTDAITEAWADAQRRFPPHRAIHPRLALAPTTELFRQMTAQPGWALASTRGDRIVLQPSEVLRTNGTGLPELLLHEMLHVLVESECTSRTPLWLREGIVEALAGRNDIARPAISPGAIDDALKRAGSLQAAQRAHRAAAGHVRMLVNRYGFSTVRDWLSSGVPAGVD